MKLYVSPAKVVKIVPTESTFQTQTQNQKNTT